MKKNIIILSISLFLLTISYFIYSLSMKKKAPSTPTKTIVLNRSSNETKNRQYTSFSDKTTFGKEQIITFNWNNIKPNLPNELNTYNINTPLVNLATINSLAKKFNFNEEDRSKETSEGSYLWINKTDNLFGSIKQNQILYFYTTDIPVHTNSISASQAAEITKKYLSDIFGDDFIMSLNNNPEIRFLTKKPRMSDLEPEEATSISNNIVVVNYKQKIDNFPVILRSRKGETISISIDTTKKIYTLNIYGGFYNLSKEKTLKPISYEKLKEIAPLEAIRISHASDIGNESNLTAAESISVEVKNVSIGYFYDKANVLIPSYIIEGIVEAKNIQKQAATYIVPATTEL